LRQLKRALFGPPLSRGLARICFPVDEHSLSATDIDPENAIEVLAYEDGWHNWRDGFRRALTDFVICLFVRTKFFPSGTAQHVYHSIIPFVTSIFIE